MAHTTGLLRRLHLSTAHHAAPAYCASQVSFRGVGKLLRDIRSNGCSPGPPLSLLLDDEILPVRGRAGAFHEEIVQAVQEEVV